MSTYYVDLLGDDGTGDGSSGNPWATLAHAIDNSIADDTIIMNAGTHNWVTDNIDSRTIQGIQAGVGGSNTTIIDGGGVFRQWEVGPNTYINDITFTNSIGSQNLGHFKLKSTADACTFLRCIFHDIENNTSATNLGGGVFNFHSFGGVINAAWTFISCKFYDLRKSTGAGAAQLFGGHQTQISPTSTIAMTNCTFDVAGTGDAQWSRIITYAGLKYDPITLTNCIFNNRSGVTLFLNLSGDAAAITMTNCCYNDFDITGITDGGGLVNADPLLIDPDNGDLRLQQDSPCIDAGTIV